MTSSMSRSLAAIVDSALSNAHTGPARLADEVFRQLRPDDYEAALREALRGYIELRLHVQQGGPVPVRTEVDKVRENRLRRLALRQGLALRKSPRRDPQAVEYGTYMLVDAVNSTLVAYRLPSGYGLTLDEIERELQPKRTGKVW